MLAPEERNGSKKMGHKFSKKHGQPSRREIKLQEEKARRDFERTQKKQEKRNPSTAREVKEELK